MADQVGRSEADGDGEGVYTCDIVMAPGGVDGLPMALMAAARMRGARLIGLVVVATTLQAKFDREVRQEDILSALAARGHPALPA